jgi:Zn-dependent peptidase ImmA (M78 family)
VYPQGAIIPIDIDAVAERVGLEFFPVPGLKSAYGVAGLLCLRGGKHYIVLDEDVMNNPRAINFYRFTVGEEVAHYILHQEWFKDVASIEDALAVRTAFREHEHDRHMERNAKWFSSGLLMPPEDVRQMAGRAYSKIVAQVVTATPDAIVGQIAIMLAKEFLVSTEAMRYRLQNYPCFVNSAVVEAVRLNAPHLWQGG